MALFHLLQLPSTLRYTLIPLVLLSAVCFAGCVCASGWFFFCWYSDNTLRREGEKKRKNMLQWMTWFVLTSVCLCVWGGVLSPSSNPPSPLSSSPFFIPPSLLC
ncbi:hypothetical protein F5H01DRAFT_357949 [Linnemannia elongata]|nr:hypothetical protein F5H01DRAFT_357949 [Linnemannia elongata]